MKAEDVYKFLDSRRTVHRYTPSEIESEKINTALELALTAPNHKFSFPWKFIVCGRDTQKKLFEIAMERGLKKAAEKGESPESVEKSLTEKFLNPAKVVFFIRKADEDPHRAQEDYASVCCAIQNFTLYLKACGYDAKWSTGALSQNEKTRSLLGDAAVGHEIDGMILVGKPAVDMPPRRRPALGDVLTELP